VFWVSFFCHFWLFKNQDFVFDMGTCATVRNRQIDRTGDGASSLMMTIVRKSCGCRT